MTKESTLHKYPSQDNESKNELHISSSDPKFNELLARYNNALKDNENLHALLDDILSSASWRITAPLRKLMSLKRRIFPLFRFGSYELSSKIERHLENREGKLEIVGPNPQLILHSLTPLPAGFLLLSFQADGPLCFTVTYDAGKGFVEDKKRIVLVKDSGPDWILLNMPAGVKKFQINPFDSGRQFCINSFKATPQGNIQALARLVSRQLSFNPVVLAAKIRRAVAVFRDSGLTGLKIKLFSGELTGNYDEWVKRYDTLSEQDRSEIKNKLAGLKKKPLISVILPTYNTPEKWLRSAIDSVRAQLYTNWELCIADDASTVPHVRTVLEHYRCIDTRIKVTYRDKNGHISEASNSALALAEGEYVALLDHDDELTEDALYMVINEINSSPQAALIYSDEDKKTSFGMRFNPYFKCDWNPELFLSQNFICHLTVYRRDIVESCGGFRKGFEGSQDWDLALRVIEKIEPKQIRHIPHILYHWRAVEGSTAQFSGFKSYALKAGAKAVEEHLVRVGEQSRVEILEEIAHYRVHYSLPKVPPLVSIIIPTRDKVKVLQRCVDSILKKTTYNNYELLIVDNGSIEVETARYFESLPKDKVRIVTDNSPFNYSRINNQAAKLARGEILAFLNNDLEVINTDWLTEMVSLAVKERNGAVGARLWFPNEMLQHAGVILGIGGVAGHNHKGQLRGNPGYFNRAILRQNFSAVTAACLLVKRDLFEKVNGFNEEELAVAFNDVDLCLKIMEAGFKNVWTPYAELYHYESSSRGYENTPDKVERFEREISYMKKRWGELLRNDPYYNPNLTAHTEDFRFSFPPRVRKPWRM